MGRAVAAALRAGAGETVRPAIIERGHVPGDGGGGALRRVSDFESADTAP